MKLEEDNEMSFYSKNDMDASMDAYMCKALSYLCYLFQHVRTFYLQDFRIKITINEIQNDNFH